MLDVHLTTSLRVRAEPRLEQFDTQLDRLGTGSAEGDGWLISWAMSPEPDPYGVWHSSQIPDPAKRTAGLNVGGFSSVDLDRAIDAARSPQPGASSTRRLGSSCTKRSISC